MTARPLPFRSPDQIIQELQFGDVLHRLAVLAPEDVRALEVLARDLLSRRWPRGPKRRLARVGDV